MNFFFYPIQSNPTIVALGMAVIGIITGALYHAFLVKVLETTPEDEDEDFE